MERTGHNEKERATLEDVICELEDSFIHTRKCDLYRVIMESVEKPLIEKVLERTFGNKVKAAKILGINRNTLQAKIKRYRINVQKFKI